MYAIETTDLTKYYGKSRGIIRVNLAVEEGDFFGFIGPNGAGKSTAVRALLGLIRPSSGSAKIFNMDCIREKNQILSEIGYLPSETVFYSGMRVKDVIRLSCDLRKKDCRKAAEELCERLQLDLMKKIDELSFGNRKKVGIVCALSHSPRLCILDEPTSGLDPLMQREFFCDSPGTQSPGNHRFPIIACSFRDSAQLQSRRYYSGKAGLSLPAASKTLRRQVPNEWSYTEVQNRFS